MTTRTTTQTREFIGWVHGLTELHFRHVLDAIGHVDVNYQTDKWNEFKENPLGFLYRWSPDFEAVWLKQLK